MASPGNQHCANCIDTLSFPIRICLNKTRMRVIAASPSATVICR